ncbi:MAG: HlyD family secretion protein, partial [Pirellula sp.]
QTDGIIQQLLVDEGSVVQADSVLIELDSRLANAEVQVAENEKTSAMLKAEDDSQIKFSEASLDVAKSVLLRSQQLYETGVETRDDLEKKNLERIKAGFQVDVSKREQKINQAAVGVSDAKLNAAKVQVELRTIKAPFSGMVAETQKERFEWVKAGDQILRLVSLEKFRVRGFVLLEESPNILEGAPARVTVPIGPGKVETIDGVVGFVKPESVGKKQSGNEYVVWVEMPNRMVNGKYLFRGGMDAKVEIYPQR